MQLERVRPELRAPFAEAFRHEAGITMARITIFILAAVGGFLGYTILGPPVARLFGI